MPADAEAEAPPLSRWRYKTRSLEKPKYKTEKECMASDDPRDLTAFVVDYIRQYGKANSQDILALSDASLPLIL
ncbi:hypothetical protein PFICI_10083 [Pestalotiopsis fici W106-1]|uniref:Uncharacterized protein n=1 Tax=Pestalotiopsis fici (strain W106-1 / CGMCC3.15140) TaxID=1229662 RepID=W3WYP5_PESFW|nr:uncharacterized protein PFICI_10083 [Pestalotiopsis fici W106-1]ETS78021.1 hypothetical protein PFICI_10083 [Pestalotiopsis fici W106-1]